MRPRSSIIAVPAVVCLSLALACPAVAQERGFVAIPIRTAAGQQVGLYAESHALVIGVSNYVNGWPSLAGVKDDVPAVQQGLETAGFSVTLVEDPTHVQLDQAITQFISDKGDKENNRLLIYYAGHGHTLKPKYGGQPLGYLVPADAPDPHKDEPGFLRTALSMRRIEEYATQIQAKHALFLFDSCFSGTIFSTARAIPEAIQERTAKPVRQFITAGDADQPVPDKSIFRPEFLKAIAGAADLNHDGYVTGTELGLYLADNVTEFSHRTQTPKYGKMMDPVLSQGDFVFPLNSATAMIGPAPPKPSVSHFDLSRITAKARQDEDTRKAWDSKLDEMKRAYAQVEAVDKGSAAADTKQAAWQEFLSAFTDQNPFTDNDDQLRAKAGERRAYWQGEADRVAHEREAKRQEAMVASTTAPSSPDAGKTWRDPVTGMEFVWVPGGTFEMGCGSWDRDCRDDSEKPAHRVTVSGFSLGKTEVTQGQWTRIMGSNPAAYGNADTYPVERVSWDDVQQFIAKLDGQSSGVKFRLPTEAEWEYACRAGGKEQVYAWGDQEPGAASGKVANLADESGKRKYTWQEWNSGYDDGYAETAPVASYPPNALGLFDMSGNVWEWVQDTYQTYSSGPATDPVVGSGGDRVRRGGGWHYSARSARCSVRYNLTPADRRSDLGFRLARTN